jgi:hypothetical protein
MEAKGNCVVERRGGEQPVAKVQSQTRVNSIRCSSMASHPGTDEACRESGEFITARLLSKLEMNRDGHGWSGNVQKEAWGNRRDPLARSKPMGVRAAIVVLKLGNASGAKGCRKENGG